MQVKRFCKGQQNYEGGGERWRTLVPEFQDLLSKSTNRPTCQFPTGNLRSPCLLPSHQITFCSVTESIREQPGQISYGRCKLTRPMFMCGDVSIAEDKAKHWGNSCSQKKTNGLPEIYVHFCSPQYFPKYRTQKWCFMKREEGKKCTLSTQRWRVCIRNPL